MLRCGHESGVSIDATFGTNDKKVCNHDWQLNVCHVCVYNHPFKQCHIDFVVPLYMMMVFDE
jgi:hypothetical protein